VAAILRDGGLWTELVKVGMLKNEVGVILIGEN
jgi:hypothetical protein